MKTGWWSQFANDPARDFELYLELREGRDARCGIERRRDGELYLVIFSPQRIEIPMRWLAEQAERAASLPSLEARAEES